MFRYGQPRQPPRCWHTYVFQGGRRESIGSYIDEAKDEPCSASELTATAVTKDYFEGACPLEDYILPSRFALRISHKDLHASKHDFISIWVKLCCSENMGLRKISEFHVFQEASYDILCICWIEIRLLPFHPLPPLEYWKSTGQGIEPQRSFWNVRFDEFRGVSIPASRCV